MKLDYDALTPDPLDFEPGEKVWFHGLKAKVVSNYTYDVLLDSIELAEFGMWAVPIQIKGASTITIAHVDDLIPRKKGEAWI